MQNLNDTAPAQATESEAATDVTDATETTEATDASEPSAAEQRAADRALAAAVFLALDPQRGTRKSVPVKAVSAFKRQPLEPNRAGLNPSPRQAAALAVAIIAAGKKIPSSGRAVTFPRTFLAVDPTDGIERTLCIENGAGRDCLVSGLATYDNATETFTVNAAAGREIINQLGASLPAEAKRG